MSARYLLATGGIPLSKRGRLFFNNTGRSKAFLLASARLLSGRGVVTRTLGLIVSFLSELTVRTGAQAFGFLMAGVLSKEGARL